MRVPGGFWKRPTNRTYAYNLDLGEHYYSPMTSYLEGGQRGFRGESPGALTYSERLAKRWLGGRRYSGSQERRARSSSVDLGITASYLDRETSARAAAQRARSEIRECREATPPFEPHRDPYNVSAFGRYKQALLESSKELKQQSMQRQNLLANRMSSQMSETSAARAAAAEAARAASSRSSVSHARSSSATRAATTSKSISETVRSESRRRVEDDVLKKISDLHMMPWSHGHELDEAQSASARARARIVDLERELDEITKRALTSRTYAMKSASQMAKEAMMEDEAAMSSSYKKSRKVMVESANRLH